MSIQCWRHSAPVWGLVLVHVLWCWGSAGGEPASPKHARPPSPFPHSPSPKEESSPLRHIHPPPFVPSKFRWRPFSGRSYYRGGQPAEVLPPVEQLYARLPREPGLRTLVHWLENLWCYPLLQVQNPTCRRMEWEADSRPLCLRPEHLKLPDKWVSFEEFLKAQLVYPYPFPAPMQTKGFPFIDGDSFKYLGNHIWETFSHMRMQEWRENSPYMKDSFDPSKMSNRSLIFWSMGNFDNDRRGGKSDYDFLMEALRKGKIRSHFFLIHHRENNPKFLMELLDHPLLLKLFAVDVPVHVRHPKLVPLPLGIRSAGLEIPALELARVITSNKGSGEVPESMLFARGFKVTLKSRRQARLSVLQPLSSAFNFTVRSSLDRSLRGAAYYEFMRKHKFVLSLRGTGADCFRTWEGLYMGRPVVVENILPPWVYDSLPVVSGELAKLQPAHLSQAWTEMSRTQFNVGRLWMPWWMTFILRECLAVP